MSDRLNITIKIAGLTPMALSIQRSQEEQIRIAEAYVNRLWANWSQQFHDITPMEVMARVAFQFAKLFVIQTATAEQTTEILAHFEDELDKILLDVN
ncbi:MAG: cell division protein ZapA [Muribaculaceae bacterium]|nr:cell division protein ZapA [Muribaculaceae bacterium]